MNSDIGTQKPIVQQIERRGEEQQVIERQNQPVGGGSIQGEGQIKQGQENVQRKGEQGEQEEEKPNKIVDQLKQQPNFLTVRYNESKQASRPGGIYVPPHRLRALQQKMMESSYASIDHQRMMWQLLRKSINGIVNKVNISNIQNIVIELFNENLERGKGLLSKAIIKAQMASPNFTHVYAALVAVINTKIPEIGDLILNRVMIMFHRSFHRNNKLVCIATTRMLAHLINQRILGEYAGLQLLMILLMHPTQDSVQIACDFMMQVGQVLSQTSPAGANAIFERFKSLLHEAQIGQKAQYSIQKLFAVRKTNFKKYPGVIPDLDLVELEDQITHNLDFENQLDAQNNLNIFREDKEFEKHEDQWDEIKKEILGEENVIELKQVRDYEEELEEYQEEEEQNAIRDLTEKDLINLRSTIYLALQSTMNFQECAHKIMKMNIAKGYEHQLIDMIIQCCMMERIYQDFFGLLGNRFCTIDDKYKEYFITAFINHYNSIFKLEASKVRNLAKFFAFLFYKHAIDWKIFQIVTLRQDTTTSAHRMFLKILFRELAENMGVDKLAEEFKKEDMREHYQGLFPIGHPNDVRFAINYFTSIGLGKLTEDMRQILAMQEQMLAERKVKEEYQKMQQLMAEQEEMLRAQEEERKELEKKIREVEERERNKQKVKKEEQQKYKRKNRSSSSSSSSSDDSSATPDVKKAGNQMEQTERKRKKNSSRSDQKPQRRKRLNSEDSKDKKRRRRRHSPDPQERRQQKKRKNQSDSEGRKRKRRHQSDKEKRSARKKRYDQSDSETPIAKKRRERVPSSSSSSISSSSSSSERMRDRSREKRGQKQRKSESSESRRRYGRRR